jgi:hypothetical protein
MEGTPVKLLYAMAFALFPLTATAQTPDASLLTALCHEGYSEDTAGQCRSLTAREDLTIEAILAQYGEIISSDADDESVFYVTDPEDVPVGAIRSQEITPHENAIARDDADSTADLTSTESTVAAQISTIGSPHERGKHVVADADELATDDPTPASVGANTSILMDEHTSILTDDGRTME